MPKFLCVCQGGNNRSAALARILRDEFGQEAVPIGHLRVSQNSLSYFCAWADYVIAMTREIADCIRACTANKLRIVDVGEDRWVTPYHPELVDGLRPIVSGWRDRNWRL
jgi:predicted xylose isomerase-like sugar epimerase